MQSSKGCCKIILSPFHYISLIIFKVITETRPYINWWCKIVWRRAKFIAIIISSGGNTWRRTLWSTSFMLLGPISTYLKPTLTTNINPHIYIYIYTCIYIYNGQRMYVVFYCLILSYFALAKYPLLIAVWFHRYLRVELDGIFKTGKCISFCLVTKYDAEEYVHLIL